MSRKIAIKRLTESDLTLFEHHHRRTAGKQKAINVNANVFIRGFYPQQGQAARFTIDLFVYGPGRAPELNLQRKLIRSHKNWRLDGELITGAITDDDGRFDKLQPGDIAVMEFLGDLQPDSMRIVFVAAMGDSVPIHACLDRLLGNESMIAVTEANFEAAVNGVVPAEDHPIRQLLLNDLLEDAAQSGERGTQLLQRQLRTRQLTQAQLEEARRAAAESGALGEEFVSAYLENAKAIDTITDFSWESSKNAIAPYDFLVTESDDREVRIDAKSTTGGFERIIHISMNELMHMAQQEHRYDIYRVYEMKDDLAQMRIAKNVGASARLILTGLKDLPKGCTVDSVSVAPSLFSFGSPIEVVLQEE